MHIKKYAIAIALLWGTQMHVNAGEEAEAKKANQTPLGWYKEGSTSLKYVSDIAKFFEQEGLPFNEATKSTAFNRTEQVTDYTYVAYFGPVSGGVAVSCITNSKWTKCWIELAKPWKILDAPAEWLNQVKALVEKYEASRK